MEVDIYGGAWAVRIADSQRGPPERVGARSQ